jgi:HEAT repeat protein
MALCLITGLIAGCHADENDAAGLAGELSDPIRRQHAISNIQRIYASTLSAADGDRQAPAVVAVADAVVGPLRDCFLENRMDVPNGKEIMRTFAEMRDPRSLPALIEGLDWNLEVSEEIAVTAANTIRYTEIPDDKKGDVITALAESYGEISSARPIDNNMRQSFIRALGSLQDERATSALVEIVTNVSADQNFLYNIYAGHQLAELKNPDAIPAFIKSLFLFAPNNPFMRMNDVGQHGLVRIGAASIPALMRLLNGEDQEAIALVRAFKEALPEAQRGMVRVADEISKEAATVLGSLGLSESFDVLMRETEQESPFRRTNAAISLVRLNPEGAQLTQVRDAIIRVYGATPSDLPLMQRAGMKMQLLAGMRQLYDPSIFEFLRTVVKEPGIPDLKITAVNSIAMLANAAEAAALRTFVQEEASGAATTQAITANEPVLAAATECDENVSCWAGKLTDSDENVARKATFMLGRLGRGNEAALTALIEGIASSRIAVRMDALSALDWTATSGSEAAVTQLNQLRDTEQGRRIWNEFRPVAMVTLGRLEARASGQ